MLVVGPEHGRVFREAGWDRAQVQAKLHELTHRRAGDVVRGAFGAPEGVDPQFVNDPEMPVAKFAAAGPHPARLRGRRRGPVLDGVRWLGVG